MVRDADIRGYLQISSYRVVGGIVVMGCRRQPIHSKCSPVSDPNTGSWRCVSNSVSKQYWPAQIISYRPGLASLKRLPT